MLKLEKVSKNFGKVTAVKDLSFELKKGDITGLLGPNGAGKTTTMRMIASFFYPSSGKIKIKGKNTKANTTLTQNEIGYLPENNPLYLDMLVIDHLVMTAKIYGIKKNTVKRVEEVAKSVGLTNKLATKISELSKGYKQRVGLAAAIIHDPSVIILDEPAEGLDPNQREEIRKLIKKLAKNKAILISTHVLQEVTATCSKVVVINNGKLVVAGPTKKFNLEQVFRDLK